MLKTWPKQLLGSLLLDIALPGRAHALSSRGLGFESSHSRNHWMEENDWKKLSYKTWAKFSTLDKGMLVFAMQ